jgi:hypothetical protein
MRSSYAGEWLALPERRPGDVVVADASDEAWVLDPADSEFSVSPGESVEALVDAQGHAAMAASVGPDIASTVPLSDSPAVGVTVISQRDRANAVCDEPRVWSDRDHDDNGEGVSFHLTPDAQNYLRGQGITSKKTWSAFRLGAVDDATIARLLSPFQRRHLRPNGIWLPTCDPRQPEAVLGLIRLTPAQNKHAFISSPAGIACSQSITTAQKVVLVDGPLLGLRLAQHGVESIAIVEDPAVLPPLLDWLAGKAVLIVGFKPQRRAAIRAALGPVGDHATELAVMPEMAFTPPESLHALGIDRALVRPEAPTPITPFLLRDLHAYAVSRIAAGEGAEALQQLGITDPDFVQVFGIGYLPADFRNVLTPDQRRTLEGRMRGNAVLIPALDEHGTIVDLYTISPDGGHVFATVHDAPRGLIAPRVCTAFDHLLVTDRLRLAARQFASGIRHVLFLRGPADAVENAKRIAAAGVRAVVVDCHHGGEAITQVLRAAGIAIVDRIDDESAEPAPALIFPVPMVEVPSVEPTEATSAARDLIEAAPAPIPQDPADLPVLVQHDRVTELATFRVGDLGYTVEVRDDAEARIEVRISQGTSVHRDHVLISSEPQRRRLASTAAQRFKLPAARIEAHLAHLHGAIIALAEQAATLPAPAAPTSSLTPAKHSDALALAKAPDLLERIGADLGTMGWIGDDIAKRTLFLAALSRKLDRPLWVAYAAASPGACGPGLNAIAAITPPEDRIHVSRLTDNALFHADPAALRHKLLVIDDGSAITAAVATALKVLRQRGGLSASQVQRDPIRGEMRTTFTEVHGPLAVLTATDGSLDENLRRHLVEVAADESPAQVSQELADRSRRLADPTSAQASTRRHQVVERLQNLQRVLAPRPVVVPFAERIPVPNFSARSRRDHETLLTLIAAHALLHQHQRLSDRGCVVATNADFDAAAALVYGSAAAGDDGLGRHAQRLLTGLWQAQATTFTMDDLCKLLPDWTRYAFRAALDELVRLDYVASPRGGRGKLREYRLLANAPDANTYDPQGRMTSLKLAKLAMVGDQVGELETNNIFPTERAIG